MVCNVGAQISIKLSSIYPQYYIKNFLIEISPLIILALLLYGVSFLLIIKIYAVNQFSVIVPILNTSIFLLVFLASSFIFNETIGPMKLTGATFIILGIIFICLEKQ